MNIGCQKNNNMKIIPKALCIKCGCLTPAKCGIFDRLCPKCLEEKKKIKDKQFYSKEKKK